MIKLNNIKIKNFKAFQNEQVINLDNNNLLIYGKNGSGKSSIYWALYTLFQSSEKNDIEKEKYFKVYDENDSNTFQSLRNVFVNNESESFIQLNYNDEVVNLSQNNLNDVNNVVIKTANLASDFINHKLLYDFFNSTNKNSNNLWKVFERDIFPFLKSDSSVDTYQKKLLDIFNNLPKGSNGYYYHRTWKKYYEYQNKINSFNLNLETTIGIINDRANRILRDKFKQSNISIYLDYLEYLSWDKDDSRVFNTPKIILTVSYQNGDVTHTNHRPQSFLNEASLTQIALSIRLAALLNRLSESEIKLLVIDDMLISLDMSNRMIVTDILLNDSELSGFQKIILTHDKMFYRIIKDKTSELYWNYLIVEKSESDFATEPKVKFDQSDIEKAQYFFNNNEYEVCANFLRKETEKIIKKYLTISFDEAFRPLTQQINSAIEKVRKNKYNLFIKLFKDKSIQLEQLPLDFTANKDLTIEEKGKLSSLRNKILKMPKSYSHEEHMLEDLLVYLKSITNRILNPGSHDTTVPLYESEMEEAISKIKELRVIINDIT